MSELQTVLSGTRSAIDVDDWRRFTRYEGCGPGDRIVKSFWEVVAGMNGHDRSALLRFCTGCSRPPLGGLGALNPPFVVRLVSAGGGSEGFFSSLFSRKPSAANLPGAATCFNMLKLPAYSSSRTLEAKLRQAIAEAEGFHIA